MHRPKNRERERENDDDERIEKQKFKANIMMGQRPTHQNRTLNKQQNAFPNFNI